MSGLIELLEQELEMKEKEMYLGENLNRAVEVRDGVRFVVLDGRENGNPKARARREGVFKITRQDGRAPGDVDYYGVSSNA